IKAWLFSNDKVIANIIFFYKMFVLIFDNVTILFKYMYLNNFILLLLLLLLLLLSFLKSFYIKL
ncbi:MAG: hypothetical protein N7Q72_04530, partial [Spiroplasma sp. Tabriz.8]|nr:hypothetical protein [Spiroplasma sp. Tabriz.8]